MCGMARQTSIKDRFLYLLWLNVPGPVRWCCFVVHRLISLRDKKRNRVLVGFSFELEGFQEDNIEQHCSHFRMPHSTRTRYPSLSWLQTPPKCQCGSSAIGRASRAPESCVFL